MKLGIVSAAVAAALIVMPACAQQRVDLRRPTGAGGAVDVSLLAGTVRVVGWNRNEVHVTGDLGRGSDRVELRTEGDRVYVQVVTQRGTRNVQGSELEVRVPARKALSVRTTSADATVEGVVGATTINSSSGGIEVSGRPASLEVSTRSGDVKVDVVTDRVRVQSISGGQEVRGTVRTELEAQSVSGDIDVRARVGNLRAQSVSGGITAPFVGGRVEAQSVSGDINVEGQRIRGEVGSVSGDVVLSGAIDRGGTTSISTHSGEIELRFARGTGAEVEFTTFSGDMNLSFAGARITRTSRRERDVVLGRGGARVEVRTFSGDVTLTDR